MGMGERKTTMAESIASTSTSYGRRYRVLDQLGEGGMGVVYRVVDRLTGQQVALKQMRPDVSVGEVSTLIGTSGEAMAIAREFRILASLRHPHIISVLDYGFDEISDGPFYTMELLENPRTLLEAAHHQPLEVQIGLLVQTLQALAYLHRRSILHRDLKPSNILVVDGQVKVVDFGLSLPYDPDANEKVDSSSGTINYMAPETLQGLPPTIAADMFAMGVIAYEVLMGVHPFAARDLMTTINNILLNEPQITNAGLVTDRSNLFTVIMPLLHKLPAARPQDANAVIAALCDAVGRPRPVETHAIRESFLSAASFVGRTEELAALRSGLDALNENGRGSFWLLGGESGVGKSRLVDEVRTNALVDGVLTARGQAAFNGGLPYQVWRDPVRLMALTAPLSDLEAGVLSELVPDIATLLERPIPPPPALPPQESQRRLFGVVAELIRRQERPLLLILEDLQWAQEGLDLLCAVSRIPAERPVMILGSYRSDEPTDWLSRLPEARIIQMGRLDRSAIARLSRSMLGAVGTETAFVDMLEQQTEGNAYFIVEVMRALAEDAGNLSNITVKTLPMTIFAGGIEQVVSRRASRIPDWARPLVQCAALFGREIDLAVFNRMATDSLGLSAERAEVCLLACNDAAVLELADNRWRFAHDKLREYLVKTIPADVRPLYHRHVAMAIESAYPNDVAWSAVLADDWQAAGDAAKATFHTRQAADLALRNCQFNRALAYYEKLVSAYGTENPQSASHADLLVRLGETYIQLAQFPAAQTALESALEAAERLNDAQIQVRAAYYLSQALVPQGEFDRARTLLDTYLPLARQVADKGLLAQVLYGLGDLTWRKQDYAQAEAYLKESVGTAWSANETSVMLYALNRLAVVAFRTQGRKAAITYWEEGRALAERTGNRERLSAFLVNLAEANRLGGEYQKAIGQYEEAYTLSREMGNRYVEVAILHGMSFANLKLGRLSQTYITARMALQLAGQMGSPVLQLHAIMIFANLKMVEGDKSGALELLACIHKHPSADSEAHQLSNQLMAEWGYTPEEAQRILSGTPTRSMSAIIEGLLGG